MNILIINSYSWNNKGDAAILIGMLTAIRAYEPNAEITVLSSTPKIDNKMYDRYNITVHRDLFSELIGAQEKKYLKPPKLVYKLINYTLLSKIGRPLNNETEILSHYLNADLIISCGGGYLGGDKLGSIIELSRIYLSKLLKKKTVLWAQSIEPINKILLLALTKYVLNNTDLVITREMKSFKYLKALNLKSKILCTSDAAFLVNSISDEKALLLLKENGIDLDRKLIGLTVRNWRFPLAKNPHEKYENYIKVMKEIIEYLVAMYNARIILLPQVINYPHDDDRILSDMIKGTLDETTKEYVNVLKNDFTVEELKGIIGQMTIFIGTRMHSNIFATSMYVPTIAVSYEQKTEGIMEMLGLSEYVVDINNIATEDIIKMVNRINENYESIIAGLKEHMENVRRESLNTAYLIFNPNHS